MREVLGRLAVGEWGSQGSASAIEGGAAGAHPQLKHRAHLLNPKIWLHVKRSDWLKILQREIGPIMPMVNTAMMITHVNPMRSQHLMKP